jgi:uncharacterized coiled-coil protein SlyX
MKTRKMICTTILSALACFALCPVAQAQLSPAPDGGYPGGNTAEGTNALFSLTTGVYNTALGLTALFHDTDGDFNTATGAGALFSNNGDRNTAHGINALRFNTVGDSNTAMGTNALYHNTTSSSNTAVGDSALFSNTTGSANTAIGDEALFSNTEGGGNTAVGVFALDENISGNFNTAVGRFALTNATGGFNTALGYFAGSSITTGAGNVVIGNSVAAANETNRTWIKNINTTVQSFSAGVNNYVTVRMTDGRLGYTAVVSSRRYKEDIEPMDKASEALLALKPVTFRLKGELDPSHRPQWGLIAEDVEKVNPDLVDRNNKGEVESVRYDMVNAMLLNEFLKEHRKVEAQAASIAELKSTVAQQQKGMDVLTAQLKEQAAQIQKVSAQLELNKRVPQTVANK